MPILLSRFTGFPRRKSLAAWASLLGLLALVLASSRAQSNPPVATIHVDSDPSHQLNAFNPTDSLGSSMDVLSHDVINKVYSPEMIRQMLSAGYGRISYRNNSELRSVAWHWNENGSWSDPLHQSGYFTGSTELGTPIRYILSYSLPHRGFTHTGGGASRLTDGDDSTYWKSNPYLTSHFTGESDSLHPQWIVLEFKDPQALDAVRITWAIPYAVSYEVDYWTGKGEPISRDPAGQWMPFPHGVVTNSPGGTHTLKLADAPISSQYIRIWMTESSNTCDTHGSADIRNCVGYAINEIYAGTLDDSGSFHDVVQHSPDEKQTSTVCSSVDPWHSAADVISGGRYEHTGFDLFFTSGITKTFPP